MMLFVIAQLDLVDWDLGGCIVSPQEITGFHLCLFVAATAATGALALGLLLLHFSRLQQLIGAMPFALIAGSFAGRYGLAETGPQEAQAGWATVEPVIANGSADVFRLLQAVTVVALISFAIACAVAFVIRSRRRFWLVRRQHTQLLDMEAELV
jgi:hypothetical protein